jgi:isoleucyl-tRNA synthetase
VHPDVDYVVVQRDNEGTPEKLILAKDLVEKVFGKEEVLVLESLKGKRLKGEISAALYVPAAGQTGKLCCAG